MLPLVQQGAIEVMKRSTWTGLIVVVAGGMGMVSSAWAAAIASQRLLGTWQCTTEYAQIQATTQDHIRFFRQGRVYTQGMFTFRDSAGHEYLYRMPSRGQWRLRGRLLTLTLNNGPLQSMHPAATKQAITENALARWLDQMHIQILSKSQSPRKVLLRINSLSAQTMRQTQLSDQAGESHKEVAPSVCQRIQTPLAP